MMKENSILQLVFLFFFACFLPSKGQNSLSIAQNAENENYPFLYMASRVDSVLNFTVEYSKYFNKPLGVVIAVDASYGYEIFCIFSDYKTIYPFINHRCEYSVEYDYWFTERVIFEENEEYMQLHSCYMENRSLSPYDEKVVDKSFSRHCAILTLRVQSGTIEELILWQENTIQVLIDRK